MFGIIIAFGRGLLKNKFASDLPAFLLKFINATSLKIKTIKVFLMSDRQVFLMEKLLLKKKLKKQMLFKLIIIY